MNRHASPRRPPLTLDVPSALVELLYARAAWGLDAAPELPPATPPPGPEPAPRDALRRWQTRYDEAMAEVAAGRIPLPGWLYELAKAGEIGLDSARRAGELRTPVTKVLTPDPERGPRINRRAAALEHTPVELVVVLPVVGEYHAHPSTRVLVTSVQTFLDDDAWARAVAAHA